jgi:hypothetical protein
MNAICRKRALLLCSIFAIIANALYAKTASMLLFGKSFQMSVSNPVSVPGYGDVRTYFSTYNGVSGNLLIQSGTNIVSSEVRLRANTSNVYEGGYAQATVLGIIEYGSFALSVPTLDTTGYGVPDVFQYQKQGSFTASGSGYTPTTGQNFSISISLNRSAGSIVGTYVATTVNTSGYSSSVNGSYTILNGTGSVVYNRGSTNIMTITETNVIDKSISLSGSTAFQVVNQNSVTYSSFNVTRSNDGVQFTVKAGSLTRSGNQYKGAFSFVDGIKETSWADYTDFSFIITDDNDSDFNGIPDFSDSIPVPPTISTQPINKSVSSGGLVTFSVIASGTPSVSYQWQKNGINISGATSSTYSINAASDSDAGIYSVIVSNSSGSVVSSGALLTVLPPVISPVIVTQPVSQTAKLGDSVTFSVYVTGSGTINYQWSKDGVILSNSNSSTYTVNPVQSTSSGSYKVVASNSSGSATSSGASLTIEVNDLLASYPLDGDGKDISDYQNNLIFSNVTASTDRFGKVGGSVYFNGLNSWAISTKDISLSGSNPRTLSVWIKSDDLTFYKGNPVVLGLGSKSGTNTLYDLTFFSNSSTGQSWSSSTGAFVWNHTSNGGFAGSTNSKLITPSQWFHLVVTSDGTRSGSKLYINGSMQPIFGDSGTWSTVLGKLRVSTGSQTSGPVNDSTVWWNQGFKGHMDDIRIYNRVLSFAEVTGLYTLESPRLTNLSVRTALSASQYVIVGFTVTGGDKTVLMRAVGPTLGNFGVPNVMLDPKLELYNGSTKVDSNDNWGGSSLLTNLFSSVGAFSYWSSSSLDAALVNSFNGGRTLQVSGPAAGTVLVEAYDAASSSSAKFSNLSARNKVGTGSNILIAGFTLTGNGTRKLLIRAVGPKLSDFGVSGVLADPKLEIYSGTTKITENDNWSSSLATTFSSVGAFGLNNGSKDAAITVSLPAGGYTVQVSGADGGVGEAIVEIYELP